ncbi:hypothetical protein QTP86_000115 [Hemibagrus guttatus]|nr:hypothetical protein QTP86_000115 [Hemibagrus guttatus]
MIARQHHFRTQDSGAVIERRRISTTARAAKLVYRAEWEKAFQNVLDQSGLDLQHALGCFAAECEAAGMRVSTSKSEAMVLDRKKVACTLQDVSLERCSGHAPPGRGPGEDPGHSGETMSGKQDQKNGERKLGKCVSRSSCFSLKLITQQQSCESRGDELFSTTAFLLLIFSAGHTEKGTQDLFKLVKAQHQIQPQALIRDKCVCQFVNVSLEVIWLN